MRHLGTAWNSPSLYKFSWHVCLIVLLVETVMYFSIICSLVYLTRRVDAEPVWRRWPMPMICLQGNTWFYVTYIWTCWVVSNMYMYIFVWRSQNNVGHSSYKIKLFCGSQLELWPFGCLVWSEVPDLMVFCKSQTVRDCTGIFFLWDHNKDPFDWIWYKFKKLDLVKPYFKLA